MKIIERILAEHMHEGYFETKDGHRECFCGHVMAEGERYREHLAAALVAAETGGLAERVAEYAEALQKRADLHGTKHSMVGKFYDDRAYEVRALLAQPAPSEDPS